MEEDIILPITPVNVGAPTFTTASMLLPENDDEKMGTFMGVFVPTCEFMWSVLLFIRFGYIAGEAGCLVACGIIILCALTMAVTASSVSAIATNGIAVGGVYVMLSNSLGRGIGGSIVIIYYIGVTLLVAVEIVGSVQGFTYAMGLQKFLIDASPYWNKYLLSVMTLGLCFAVVVIGTCLVHKLAAVFLVVLVASFLSLYIGLIVGPMQPNGDTFMENLYPAPGFSFASTLSLVLPCFIGLYSGVNNARVLKNPRISIPLGAFGAIGFSSLLYLVLILLFTAAVDRETLIKDSMIGPKLAWPSKYIAIPAVYLVGIGAALQCLVMTSSVLWSIANDDLLPILTHLNLGSLIGEEPRMATIATTIIVLPLMLVNVDLLAEWTTMCFLLCYGSTNFACFLLSAFQSPNWRPKFRIHGWIISSSGFILCLSLMFLIQWQSAFASIIIAAIVAYMIQTSSASLSWGQGMHGLIFHIMLNYLVAVEQLELTRKLHHFMEQNEDLERKTLGISSDIPAETIGTHLPLQWASRVWRPQMVCFIKMADKYRIGDSPLLAFTSQLRSRSALCIIVNVLAKDEELSKIERIAKKRNWHDMEMHLDEVFTQDERRDLIDEILMERRLKLREAMEKHNILGFAKVLSAPTIRIGQRIFLQTMGLGELTPNTLVIPWPDESDPFKRREALSRLEEMWTVCKRLDLSCLFVKNVDKFPLNRHRINGFIDIWWIVQEGQLLLMISYLLRQHDVWKDCRVRLFTLHQRGEDSDELRDELVMYLDLMRIKVDSITFVDIDLLDYSIAHETNNEQFAEVHLGSTRERHDRMAASKITNEAKKEASHHSRRRLHSQGMKHARTMSASSSSPSVSEETSTIFVDSQFFKQLREQMILHSKEAEVVIMNLQPIEQSEAGEGAGLVYMDVVEWMISEFRRTILVYASVETATSNLISA